MKNLKLITKRFPLSFNQEELSTNELDFDAIEKELPKGQSLIRRPLLVKQLEDYLYVTLQVEEKSGGLGFGK